MERSTWQTLAKLTNINVIAVQEGQGSTAQTVTLKAGLNTTVNVAPDTAGDPSPGITITGANNTDVINLGAGNDTVTLGANETVNGGTGIDIYNVTKSTIGNTTIKGVSRQQHAGGERRRQCYDGHQDHRHQRGATGDDD